MSELHYLSATEALDAFRDRSLSPVELMQAVLDRADAVEPTVNALAMRFDEHAMAAAHQAEARYLGRGPDPRPLEGIPLAIKEEEAVAGHPYRQASLIFDDQIARHSSPFAERMLDSGAIVHARSTAPEFSCAGFTHSLLYGITRNPWNPEFAVGGSSGGSGAALACGSTTLASGSDIGGSIRIPASFNGVVGFRPPYGRVPQDPPFNLDTFCCVGPMARTVADCAAFQNTIAWPHPRDHVSLRPKLVLPTDFGGIAGLRIALSVGMGDFGVDPEVARNTAATGQALREAGATVEEIELPVSMAQITRVAALHFEPMMASWTAAVTRDHADLTNDYTLEFIRLTAEQAAGGSFVEELELQSALQETVGLLLDDYDALVCPTVGTRGLVAGDSYVGHGLTVGDVEVSDYADALCTVLFNVTSRCPVLSVPSGFADNGVPTGVQIVGRAYDDLTVFQVGAALEKVMPWLDIPRRRPSL